MATCRRRSAGKFRLHIRRYRNRHRIHLGQQHVQLDLGNHAITIRKRTRFGDVATPNSHKFDIRVRGEASRVTVFGPVACAQ